MTNARLRDLPALAPDKGNLSAVISAIQEALQTFRGSRGDRLDRALTLRDLDVATQRAVLQGGTVGGDSTTVISGGSGSSGGSTTPDPTPPPTPTGTAVLAGFSYIYISHDTPVYTQGHGHAKTRVFGAKWPTSDPTPPTFVEAVQLFEFQGDFGAYPTDTGTRWCIWTKWVSVDGYESGDPDGGTNGVQATTGKIGNADLNPLIITADKLSAGTYQGINLVPNPGAEDGVEAWALVESTGTVPTLTVDTAEKKGGSQSFKITKVAGANGAGYGCRAIPLIPGETYSIKVSVKGDSASASGLYVRMNESAAKPASGYVTLAERDSYLSFVGNGPIPAAWAAYEFTYTVPAGVYWGSFCVYQWTDSVATSVWFDDAAVGRQITASHIAAGSIAVGSAAIADGAIRRALIELAAIDDARVANLSAAKLTVGDGTVGGDLKSTSFTPGSGATPGTGWRIRPDGTAEYNNIIVRGTVYSTNGVFDGQVTIRDSAGAVLFSAGQGLNVNLLSGGQGFVESWESGSIGDWQQVSGSAELPIFTTAAPGAPGSKALHIGNNSGNDTGWIVHPRNIPFNPNALYRMRVVARQDFGTGVAFFGVVGVGSDGSTLVNANGVASYSSQHYIAGNSLAVAASWTEYVGYFRGVSATGTTSARPDAGNPGRLHEDVRYIRPIVIANYNGLSGRTDVAFVQIECLTGALGTIDQITGANITTWMASAAIGDAQIGNLSADKINAGAIRGINVNAASHTTIGSYLTSAASAGATTLNVKSTADFPSSGTAFIIDSSNDHDTITYSGKTATSLTGCSGVLAHNSNATIIPRDEALVIDRATNELRVYGVVNGSTAELVASIGTKSFNDAVVTLEAGTGRHAINATGSSTAFPVIKAVNEGSGTAIRGEGPLGVYGQTVTGDGVRGHATSSGDGVVGTSVSGYGGNFSGNATRSQIMLTPLAGRPSVRNPGSLAMIYTAGGSTDNRTTSARLCYAHEDGNWRFVDGSAVHNG